jgi:hypothetical protein
MRLNDTDLYGRARYHTSLGMQFTDVGGVNVRVYQLVDNLDNKALCSLVLHGQVEVDRITAPAYATLVDEWVATIPR